MAETCPLHANLRPTAALALLRWLLVIVAIFPGTPTSAQGLDTPTITSLSASSGRPGDVISIQGTNFALTPASNSVWFGAVKGQILSASSSTIQVVVPFGATYGNISVLTPNDKIAVSSAQFVPVFSPGGPITDHSFGQASSFPPASKPPLINLATDFSSPTQGVTLSDLNDDGKPDLVTAHWNNDIVTIFQNSHISGDLGVASFTPAGTYSVGSRPTDIAAGDLNGDGRPDLVVANWNGNSISVLQNASAAGTISFSPAVTLAVPILFPASALPPSSVRIADVDGDGWLDILVSGENPGVLRNKGLGGALTATSFEEMVVFSVTGGAAYDMAVADFDNDGKPDILVTGYPNKVSVLRNTSTPGVITSASFAAPIQFATSSSAAAVAAGDLNGDGKADLILATTSSTLHIFPNKSTPGSLDASSFGTRVDLSISQSSQYALHLSVADLNGDASPEILITNRYNPGIFVCVNAGAATFAASFTSFVGLNIPAGDAGTGMYGRVAVGDLNADGRPDLAVDGEWGKIQVSQNFVQPLTVTSFVVSPSSGSVKVPWYRTRNFTAAQLMSDGSSMDVTPAATWSSSAPAVATVNSAGKAIGSRVGSTTISASYGGRAGQATLTVQSTTFGTLPGNPDERFLPTISNGTSSGAVYALAHQPDGKVIIGGAFSSVNGFARNNLARLNDDGTLDHSFDPGLGPDGSVQSLCLDGAGNVLIVGRFSSVNGTTRRAAARLFPDGILDLSFNANLVSSTSLRANVVCARSDGRILIGGNAIQVVGESTTTFLLQVNPNGSRDSSFNAVSVTSGEANALTLQPDGGLIIGGSFLRYGTTGLFCIARLTATGALDESFQIGIQTSRVYGIALQPDGKLVVVGDFSVVFGQSIKFITRFNSDGTLDSSFSSPTASGWGIIQAVALQQNGKIVVSKSFVTVRLNLNGSIDSSYSASVYPDWDTRVISVDPNEKIWVAGGISSVNGSPTMGIARLHGDVTTFRGWQSKYFSETQLSDDPVGTGPTGDLSGEGIGNQLRYAFGLSPFESGVNRLPRHAVMSGADGSFLYYTFTRLRQTSDLVYKVGFSHDLNTWDYSEAQIEQVGLSVPKSDGLTEEITVRLAIPIEELDSAFLKLKVFNSQ